LEWLGLLKWEQKLETDLIVNNDMMRNDSFRMTGLGFDIRILN